MKKQSRGITLIALIITIIILLILAGISIASLGGENGLIAKASQAKKTQIKAEMKEQLVLALSELQLDKNGEATLDDITQEWANNTLKDYKTLITNDASTSEKKVTMSKNNIFGKYIIDEKLNIVETEEITGANLAYEVKSRNGEELQVVVTVTDNENGLKTVEYNDGHIQNANGLKSVSRDCTIQLGVEYKVKIISENGEEKTETILINDYYHTITKNLQEGIIIDNKAVKTAYNKPYNATITTQEEYVINTLTVTMGGQLVEVDKSTGIINIEKVTGDIEITATAKKLEIITTTAYVNTSQNATSSASTNSIDKSTTPSLYVSFKATLLGQNCTIEPPLTQSITKNGKYIYTITGTYQGKTIKTTKEVTVDQFKSAPNLVQYDAGEWTESEIQELQNLKLYDLNATRKVDSKFKLNVDNGLNFTFGGFTFKGDTTNTELINSGTIITSRNQSIAPESGLGTPIYEGWQLFVTETKKDSQGNKIKNENGTDRIYVKSIVHAGSPENFVFYKLTTSSKENARAEYLLSSGTRQSTYNTLSDGTKINSRHWNMYKDKELDGKGYIEDVHIMTYDEALAITGEIDPKNPGLRDIRARYWLATAYNSGYQYLHYVSSGGSMSLSSGTRNCCGIRPVVEMVDGVYIASGTGTESDPYVLAKE